MWKGSDIGKAKVAAAGAAAGRPAPCNAARLGTVRWVAAIAVCAILAAGLALWLWPRGGGSAVRQGSGTGGVRRPEAKAATTPPPAPAPKAADAATASPKAAPAAPHGEGGFVKAPGTLRLPDGQVLTFPPPAEGETRRIHAYGRTYECDHLGNFRDVTPRRLFGTAFEANFLALAQPGGRFIPAFLTGLDEADVRRMLERGYAPRGDETEEEMQSLRAYDEMRCAVLEYMDQGGSFDDFVDGVARMERGQRLAHAAALREVMSLVKEGRIGEAREMSEAADRLMRERGYEPVRLPAHVREAFGAAE